MPTIDIDLQRRASEMVQREVIACLSNLIDTLAKGYGELSGNLGELAEEAFELCTPILDWEEAALQEGWVIKEMPVLFGRDGHETVLRESYYHEKNGEHADADPLHDDWEALCDEKGIEPYDREVYEHWAVSNWLARRLKENGEKVLRFDNFEVWARCTTGQAISIDDVIETITREMLEAK